MDSAPGPDGLTPRLIKDLFSSQAFFVFFLMFVNFCFLNAWVPEAWKSSKIFILYKGKGNPFCADSYRGIALCCILAKLFERLLLFRLQCWWRSSSLYRLSQFGFRSGSSTLDAVFVLQTLVNFVCRLNRHELHACFIHLKKAFPSVSRLATFEYLIELGVPRLLVAAIRSLYQLNVTHLRIGSFLYRKFIVTLGLLEGSVLSPLLFSIVFSFVWRVVDPLSALLGVNSAFKIDDVWILAFADDLVVLSPNRELLTRVLIQLDAEFLRFNLRSKISLFKTVNLLRQLQIHSISRLRCYFLSFVQAQLYGLELLPYSRSLITIGLRTLGICTFAPYSISLPAPHVSFFTSSGHPTILLYFACRGAFLFSTMD
jgi:hypothetical protein